MYLNIGVKKLRGMAKYNEGRFAIFICSLYLIIIPKFEEYLLEVSRNNRVIDGNGGDFE
nr:DNA-binding protein [uncultured Lachnoanaerobaculum sp.]